MAGEDYLDVASILGSDTLVPVTFNYAATGCGPLLDASCDSTDLPQGTQVQLPLWLTKTLAARSIVAPKLPAVYGQKFRRKIQAGAACEDLRARAPHFYDVSASLGEIAPGLAREAALGAFVKSAFAGRYTGLLAKSLQRDSSKDASEITGKLSEEERTLFDNGTASMQAMAEWKQNVDGDLGPDSKRLRAI